MKTIIVTGTPCTGKTTYAKKLAREKGYKYLDVNQVIKAKKLKESYDGKRKCYIIDTARLNKALIELINKQKKQENRTLKTDNREPRTDNRKLKTVKGLVIDSHLSHYLPRKYVDLCIVTKCNLKELKARLEKRGYSKQKIQENLQAEIFEICLTEAQERGHKIKIIDTSKK
jgi:adenylate kinase